MQSEGSVEKLHYAFATDDNYCQHLAVTLRSLMVNNPNSDVVAHVIVNKVSQENINRLESTFSRFSRGQIIFYQFDSSAYEHFRVDGHISITSYIRLFLTSILPKEINRIIYLDCDLVIVGDIRHLSALPLGQCLIAAAPDLYADENDRLGLDSNYIYFNAGVLVIDLDAWRRIDLQSRFIAFVEDNHNILTYHDQDALNSIFQNQVLYLDISWNFQARTKFEDVKILNYPMNQFSDLERNKKIIHYSTHEKPWLYWPDVPYEKEYFKYLPETPWANFKQPDKKIRSVVKRHLRRHAPSLVADIERFIKPKALKVVERDKK